MVLLHQDVRATNALTLDIELTNGRPVAVFLDALADPVVFQHIDGLDVLGLDAAGFENLNGAAGKTALWKARSAFHEKQHGVGFDQFINALLGVAHSYSGKLVRENPDYFTFGHAPPALAPARQGAIQAGLRPWHTAGYVLSIPIAMKIDKNTAVTLRYKVSDTNGKTLEESREPMVYLHGGYGNTFAKIEAALDGQSPGYQTTVELQAQDAFGLRDV